MESFGKILRRLRKAKGLTQQALADIVGVKREQIARLETDDTVEPLWKTVRKIADALGVDCSEFQKPKNSK